MDNATEADGSNGESGAVEDINPATFAQLIDIIRAEKTPESDRSIAMMQAGLHLGRELVDIMQELRVEVHELRCELLMRPPAKASAGRRTKAAAGKKS